MDVKGLRVLFSVFLVSKVLLFLRSHRKGWKAERGKSQGDIYPLEVMAMALGYISKSLERVAWTW